MHINPLTPAPPPFPRHPHTVHTCTTISPYLPGHHHGDGLHQSLTVHLIESHHFALEDVQMSLWHDATTALSVLALVHGQEEDKGSFVCHLKILDLSVSLQQKTRGRGERIVTMCLTIVDLSIAAYTELTNIKFQRVV